MGFPHRAVKISGHPSGRDLFLQLPEVATASLVTAASANEGGIVYDATSNTVKFSDGSSWTSLSTTAAAGTLDQVYDNGATIDAAADAATAVQIGGAAANDKILFYHNATDGHITTGAGDLHLEPAGADVYITGDCYVSADVRATAGVYSATLQTSGAATLASCSVTGILTAGSYSCDAIAAATAAASLHLDGNAAGGVHICETSTGGIVLGDDVTMPASKTITLTGAAGTILTLTAGDIVGADSSLSLTDADNDATFVLTNNTYTDGASGLIDINASGVITGTIINVVANGVTTGTMCYLETSAAGPFAGKYIQCYDGGADDFSVGANGATVIAGSAVGTAALTVDAGDLKLTAGVIDQDIVTDHANVFTRAQATTTKDFFQVLCTDTSDDHCALYVAHSGTAAIAAAEITSAGSAEALLLTNTKTDGMCLLAKTGVASATVPNVKIDGNTNNWIGAASTGMLHLDCDGALAQTTTSCLYIAYSGAPAQASTLGTSLHIEDDGSVATGVAVYIHAHTGEALKVGDGKSYFDEGVIVGDGGTGYVSSNGAQDLVLRTNEGTNSGTITITDGVDGDITLAPDGAGSSCVTKAAVTFQHRTVAAGTAADAPDATDGLVEYATDGAQACAVTLPEAASNLGLMLTFHFETDGGKDVTITRAGADVIDDGADVNNTSITFAEVGDTISIIAVGDNRWLVLGNAGGTLA